MNKKKIKEALQVVDKAFTDEDFNNWIRENREELNLEYDNYKDSCYETGEEPDSFYTWALWQYVTSVGCKE